MCVHLKNKLINLLFTLLNYIELINTYTRIVRMSWSRSSIICCNARMLHWMHNRCNLHSNGFYKTSKQLKHKNNN